jgi:spectinomycin phosphotransferase
MREPPKLANAAIIAALHAHYRLAVTTLTFLPIGNDLASSVYRVHTADGATYFLKARTGAGFSVPSLAVPSYFHDQGLPHIVAPIPTSTQDLWISVDNFALSLYPFLDSRTGADAGMADQHWRALGAMMRQGHASALPPDLLQIIPREPFVPTRRGVIDDLEVAIDRQNLADPAQHELAAFWRARRAEIRSVVAQADALGRRLRRWCGAMPICTPGMCCRTQTRSCGLWIGTRRSWR